MLTCTTYQLRRGGGGHRVDKIYAISGQLSKTVQNDSIFFSVALIKKLKAIGKMSIMLQVTTISLITVAYYDQL